VHATERPDAQLNCANVPAQKLVVVARTDVLHRCHTDRMSEVGIFQSNVEYGQQPGAEFPLDRRFRGCS
jgi:hypothetical protein